MIIRGWPALIVRSAVALFFLYFVPQFLYWGIVRGDLFDLVAGPVIVLVVFVATRDIQRFLWSKLRSSGRNKVLGTKPYQPPVAPKGFVPEAGDSLVGADGRKYVWMGESFGWETYEL